MKTIFLFTGGYTGERVISLQSAETFRQHLNPSKYIAYTIELSRQEWMVKKEEKALSFSHKNCSITLENGQEVKPDVALIALHGPPGENGWLQGYLSMQQVPFTTGDTLSMSLSFDKKMSVDIAAKNNIPVAKSRLVRAKELKQELVPELLKTFELPLFVKPNASGSSLGVSKVNSAEDLFAALQLAVQEGDEILVESLLVGKEITCGVFKLNGELKALPPTEIRSHNAFFDFEAKYNKASDEITPAEVPSEWIARVQEEAKKAYLAFNCRGVIRVDFMVNADGVPYMIEPNTVPGMSKESIVPQQLRAAGIPLSTMIDAIIDEALAG